MAPKKTKKRRRKVDDADYTEGVQIAKRIQSKYTRQRGGDGDRATPSVLRPEGKILNPTRHDDMIKRCVQNHLTKLMAPEEPPKFVPRVWLCAFCGQQSCHGELGDLFGPHYVGNVHFPDYLPTINLSSTSNGKTSNGAQTSSARHSPDDTDVQSDVWFHLGCALWTPNLLFFAGKFPRLGEELQTAWHQKCDVCKKMGASIPIVRSNLFVHYPCAKANEYRLIELTLTCRRPANESQFRI